MVYLVCNFLSLGYFLSKWREIGNGFCMFYYHRISFSKRRCRAPRSECPDELADHTALASRGGPLQLVNENTRVMCDDRRLSCMMARIGLLKLRPWRLSEKGAYLIPETKPNLWLPFTTVTTYGTQGHCKSHHCLTREIGEHEMIIKSPDTHPSLLTVPPFHYFPINVLLLLRSKSVV